MKDEMIIIVLCVILIFALILGIIAASIRETTYDFEETTYTVEKGDCLWYIANEYCPNSMDRHEYIKLIQERNNLENSTIYPGQQLIVYQVQE